LAELTLDGVADDDESEGFTLPAVTLQAPGFRGAATPTFSRDVCLATACNHQQIMFYETDIYVKLAKVFM